MTARIESVGNLATSSNHLDPFSGGSSNKPGSGSSSGSSSGRGTLDGSGGRDFAVESVASRLELVERQMAKMRLDLGELMVVYDDMQVWKTLRKPRGNHSMDRPRRQLLNVKLKLRL